MRPSAETSTSDTVPTSGSVIVFTGAPRPLASDQIFN
jgi:hypothetical protein